MFHRALVLGTPSGVPFIGSLERSRTVVTIRETINHGSYRNVREVTVPTVDGRAMAKVMASSPYAPAFITGPMAQRMALAIKSGGSYSLGWTDWEVVR